MRDFYGEVKDVFAVAVAVGAVDDSVILNVRGRGIKLHGNRGQNALRKLLSVSERFHRRCFRQALLDFIVYQLREKGHIFLTIRVCQLVELL